MAGSNAYMYDVALSFAGEDRGYVSRVAEGLVKAGVKVFYDEYETVTLWGKDLYTHLSDVYQNQARYTVLFASQHYAAKVWTSHERKSAQARAIKERTEYILPTRFDDSEIPGLLHTTGYIDLKKTGPDKLVELILQKLGRKPGTWEVATNTVLPGESVSREESLRDRQARLAEQKRLREARESFRTSQKGADMAREEAAEMFSHIKKEVVAFRETDLDLAIHVMENHHKVLCVSSKRASFTMHLGMNPPNLFTREFDGPYSLDSFGPRKRDPSRETHIAFDVDDALRAVWKDEDAPNIALTGRQLADKYLSRLVDRSYAPNDEATDADWDD